MTKDEFISQADRLVSHFGKRSFSEERLKLLWASVSFFPVESFKRVTDYFIGEVRLPPSNYEIVSKLSGKRSSPIESRYDLNTPISFECNRCQDIGAFWITEDGMNWAYKCSCQAGKRDPRSFIEYKAA